MPAAPSRTASASSAGEPAPEPIRWFGTSWVERGRDYWLRRAVVPVGALIALLAGVYLLFLGIQGVVLADSGGVVNVVLVLAVVVCSLAAAARSWRLFTRGHAALSGWMAEDRQLRPMLLIGFAGSLAAYFARSLTEAPGESLRRAEYEEARARAAARAARPRPKRKRR